MRRRIVMALAVLATTATVNARADIKDFTNYCTTAALHTCASVQVETIPNGSGGTIVVMRVRNLQGTLAMDNTGGGIITKIALSAPTITGASNLTVTTQGSVGVVGNPASFWQITNTNVGGPVAFSASTNTQLGGIAPAKYLRGGIMGCDNAYVVPTSYFQTCGATSGWVEFSFTTTNSWSAKDAQIAWHTDAVVYNNGGYKNCRTLDPVGAWEHCQGVAVTPEPITMTLLGTGLASLGGVGLIRRRKKGTSVTGG